MCKKPEPIVDFHGKEVTTPSEDNKRNQVTPTHSKERKNDYDWFFFLAPALLWKITPVYTIYCIAIARIVVTHLMLSAHYLMVDKDNYLNKLSQKQMEREKRDYLTGYYIHMWAQVALQVLFPSMFFADSSEILQCAVEVFWAHMLVVEPLYYVVHRWLHVPEHMKAMHGFHHLSINTLPTTSLVQNFEEHFVYIATFGPAFFVPWLLGGRQHWLIILAYLVGFDTINAWGHTNVRIRHWLFNSPYSLLTYLFYTPEFHLGHHAYFNKNFALFCPLWDYLGGTYREYKKKNQHMLPMDQQDFVFIGHNGGLGHLFTIPELRYYNMYDEYTRTLLPIKLEFYLMHMIASASRMFTKFYTCSRYCIANEYIGRIICLPRSPWDYLSPKSYGVINEEILDLMRTQHQKFGTRYFGLGNLNKMQPLNDSGIELERMVNEDEYLKDKNIRIWTGDTLTVASVYHQIADIKGLKELYYIGAGGKVGKAVCTLLTQSCPQLKIRIFSRNQVLDHPNISYSTDLSEVRDYKVALIGKMLPREMYDKAFDPRQSCKTRCLLDYTVPKLPIDVLARRKEEIYHVRVGLLKTDNRSNKFLKGHFDVCMSHDENHIVPCHFGCLLNTFIGRESNEVGDIKLQEVEQMWKMAIARGFTNVDIPSMD